MEQILLLPALQIVEDDGLVATLSQGFADVTADVTSTTDNENSGTCAQWLSASWGSSTISKSTPNGLSARDLG